MKIFNFIITLAILASTVVAQSPLQLTQNGESLTASPKDGLNKVFHVPTPLYRIPNDLLAYHYEITLRPILTNFGEEGDGGEQWTSPSTAIIWATCVSPTRNITLHSKVKEIDEDSVTVLNVETGLRIPVETHTYVTEKEFYVITLQTQMQRGQRYSIFISYTADVSTTSLSGLYRSHYDDPISGETK